MSSSIVWAVPTSTIEEAVTANLGLESMVKLWGCVFDDVGLNVGFIIEVDDVDMDRIHVDDMEVYELEDGELVQ